MANPINDKPNNSHQKVDFATILKRRGRSVKNYVRSLGLETETEIKKHMDVLRNNYVVTETFENECLSYIIVKPAMEKSGHGSDDTFFSSTTITETTRTSPVPAPTAPPTKKQKARKTRVAKKDS